MAILKSLIILEVFMKSRLLKVVAIILILGLYINIMIGCTNKPVKLNTLKDKINLDMNKFSLVFEDNFDFIDKTRWNVTDFGNGMRRAGYYTDDSDTLYCEDGKLIMKAINKNGKYGEGIYTSWLSSSKNYYENSRTENFEGFNQKYGYFEIKCIPLKGVGIWSAFWMMPDRGNNEIGSKDGAEIDIMESHFWPQEKIPNKMCHAIHVDENLGELKSSASKVYIIDNFYEEFHTFGLMWTPTEYVFYVDGYETWRTSHYNGVSEVEQYLKITVEVAGKNDGSKPTSWGTNKNNDPRNNDWQNSDIKLVVDYVKAYSYNG